MLLKPAHGPMRGPLGAFFRGFNRVFDGATNGYVGVVAAARAPGGAHDPARRRGGRRRRPLRPRAPGRVHPGRGPGAPRRQRAAPARSVARAHGRRAHPGRADPRQDRRASTPSRRSAATASSRAPTSRTSAPSSCASSPGRSATDPALHVKGIMAQPAAASFAQIPEAIIFPFNIPTISGFGASAGFNFLLQDRSGTLSVEQLGAQTRKFLAAARQRPELGNLFTSFDPNYPQVKVELDREKARTLGVPDQRGVPGDVGGAGRQLRQRLQPLRPPLPRLRPGGGRLPPEARGHRRHLRPQRDQRDHDPALDARHDHVGAGHRDHDPLQPVPLGGDQRRARRAATRPGRPWRRSRTCSRKTMPKEMGFAYSALSYQEKMAPPAAPTFILAIVFVFLLLAAMYESWRLPWAVLLGSPLVALGAFFGVWLMGYDNNVYVQIGLIMLIGLAAKNAILIVEFAKAKQDEGHVGRGRRARVRAAALPADPDDGLRLHPRRRAADARERRRARARRTSWARRCSGACWSPPRSACSSSRATSPSSRGSDDARRRKPAAPARSRRRPRCPASEHA